MKKSRFFFKKVAIFSWKAQKIYNNYNALQSYIMFTWSAYSLGLLTSGKPSEIYLWKYIPPLYFTFWTWFHNNLISQKILRLRFFNVKFIWIYLNLGLFSENQKSKVVLRYSFQRNCSIKFIKTVWSFYL